MGANLSVSTGGLTDALRALSERIDVATGRAVGLAAHAVVTAAKREATHRPGPNVITGNLRRSIGVDGPPHRDAPGVWSAVVAPHAPQARRLELGFGPGGSLGIDSLGRHYHQKPYPYLRPGLDRAHDRIAQVATDAWRDALRGE